jgi:transcriptional antiterminator
MEINKRCIDIIQFIISENDYVKLTKLSDIYNVSDRTIRYDLERIEKFLVKNGLGYMNRQHNKGVRIENNNDVNGFIEKFINSRTPYNYHYIKEERRKYILMKLLEARVPVKLEHFQKTLYVSKNTVLKELDELDEWIKLRNLKLVKKPRFGILVEGEEIVKRKAISELTQDSITSEELLRYINSKNVKSKLNNLQLNFIWHV